MRDDEIAGDCSDDRAASYAGTDPVPIAAPAPAWSRLPVELRQRRQWLLAGPDAKGDLKVPTSVYPLNGALRPGSSTDRETWLSFERASMWAAHYRFGIGYVLAADDPFACIDLDVKDGTTPEQISLYTRMAAAFDSYAERSQSGKGLHIWCFGKIGQGLKRDGVEVYSQERFIACTGDVWMDRPVRERQEYLTNMVTQMRTSATGRAELVELEPYETDDVALARCWRYPQKGEQFRQLWHGYRPDGSLMWDAKGNWIPCLKYPSQSEADYALLGLLCLTLRSDAQVKRLFRMSALGKRLHRKSDPEAYLNFTLSGLRESEGGAVSTLPAIDINAVTAAHRAKVAATMPKFG